jgi:predicted PurR-regulated permease PerM
MELDDKTIRKLSVIGIIAILAIISFFLIRPVLISIISGLILAYIFLPVKSWVSSRLKKPNENLVTSIVSLIAFLIIAIPLWFIIPLMINQVFAVFRFSQTLDISGFISSIFPGASQEFTTQMIVTLNSLTSQAASGVLNVLVNFFLDIPVILLNVFVIAFVFFFALRDGEKLKALVRDLSPLSKRHEKILVDKFRGITDSILYGQVVIGLAQGIVAGIAFLIFGIPNALILTVLAVAFSIIPIVGPGLVWFPVAVYLFLTSNIWIGIAFLAYHLFLTSTVDNFLRPYIVAKRSDSSQVVVLIGMIGGLFVFGVVGLIIGPLVLAYLLTFINAYREKTLRSFFEE